MSLDIFTVNTQLELVSIVADNGENGFQWIESDKNRAGFSVFMDTYAFTNENLFWKVNVPAWTFQRMRSNLMEFGDIPDVLEGKQMEQENAREVGFKEWI